LGERLQSELKCGTVFLTRGAEGITVAESGKQACHLPTKAREVFDVNGAGEAVLAAVVAGKLGGLTSTDTGRFANICAGLAVSKPGLAEISRQELVRFEQRLNAEITAEKLLTLDRLKLVVDKARADKKRVVWTNGCYDIMHVGHILYLEKAKALGDILVVGLNSDASVRKYKGPLRPIVEETQRAKLLTSLTCVDYVVIFDDESPIRLIEKLHPDIYAKGGDYTVDTINQDERHVVEAYGGEIALLPGVEGMSTTNIIDKILEAYKD
ncbi:MAG: D-glycero-beta-D-manno-heptose 1-phosphate adenylyltransferase, partial [Actinobacteria bacterium]|nr:D-glycero-beta-D-manno-heptose 1-phosphate adenylyltransferase [Actinomycetota bacterium]